MKESKVGTLAVIIVALATIFGTIAAAPSYLPVYFYYVIIVVILLLVIVSSLLTYRLLEPPIYDSIKKRREVRKHKALAGKYFDKFELLTEMFGGLLWKSKTVNIPDALRDSQSSQEFRQVFYLSADVIFNHFRDLLDCFKERRKRFDRTKEDFILLVNEFDIILNMYNEFYLCEPVKEIRGIGQDKFKESFKEDYKEFKGAYERFIWDYTHFEKELNKKFDKMIFREDFEMPGEL